MWARTIYLYVYTHTVYIRYWANPIYGVHTVFLAGNHHTYGHVQCVYTVLASPRNE